MFPVETVLPALSDSLARNRSVVLHAPPGSGKTTCVPPALLDAPFLRGKKILLLEPRRLAARSAAAYIARQRGEAVGETIGYQIRLERKISVRTRIEIVTEGLLTQRLLADPELRDVGLVIFDEFHERSLFADMGLVLVLDVRRALRTDLRLLIMSATLDTDAIATHLGDADVHTADGRMFPVSTEWLDRMPQSPLHVFTANAVCRALMQTEGDVLVFLPGEGEIRRTFDSLHTMSIAPHTKILPLFGSLSREEQDEAIRPARPGERKVVLATSIAETSLTIEGVRVVIDAGWMRVPRFSPRCGMMRLETLRVTRDRADQRRGRAGRVAPGVCYRLWDATVESQLAPTMMPEILDADLSSCVLQCAEWGCLTRDGLPWLTPPPDAGWHAAVTLLQALGALDVRGALTPRGRLMVAFPTHPRLAHAMLECGGAYEACRVAALLSEVASGGGRMREVDMGRLLDALARHPHEPLAMRVAALTERFVRGCAGVCGHVSHDTWSDGVVLALAFPDRIAKRRDMLGSFLMSNGRGASIEREDALATADWLVAAELSDGAGDAKIRLAAPITEEEIETIFADVIEDRTVTVWDKRTDSVRAVTCRMLNKLVLREGGQSAPDDDAVRDALLEGIRQKGIAQLPWTPATRALQERVMFLHRVMPVEAGWPDMSDDAIAANLEEWVGEFCHGMSRWAHVQKLNLVAVLTAVLASNGKSIHELDGLAPTRMTVPSGSNMQIRYDQNEPYVAVRIQEIFGLKATPKIAGGRVAIVMHLLSPAQRPVQVTRDLESFWETGYALIRKDLRGRYPKHYWPENPNEAIPTHRCKP